MDKTQWQAGLNEQRSAWGVAMCSIIVIILAASQPQWFAFLTGSKPTSSQLAHQQPSDNKSAVAIKTSTQTIHAKAMIKKAAAKKEAVKPTHKIQPNNSKAVHKTAVNHPRTQPKASTTTKGFYVQIGAFKDRQRAQRLQNKLKKKGWKTHMIKRKNGLNAIWLGPESSHSKAEKLLKNIQNKLKYTGFIVQRKP